MHVLLLNPAPGGDAVASWKAAGSPKQAMLAWQGAGSLETLQRLGRRTAVWLEATPADEEEALDLAVAGAAHIVARWPRDQAWIAAVGQHLGDLLVVASPPDALDAAAAAAPDAVLAALVDGGLEVEEPPAEPAAEAA